jgi:hypothetical protein
MIVMNFLANSIPFNNQSTGAISDKYPSLFTPSGFTFSIWGIIYIFLGIYVVKTVLTVNSNLSDTYLQTVMLIFVATSVLNVLWLLSWHYDYILLSTITMALFLVLLLIAMILIPSNELLIKSAFSLYAAWLSVAFIANVTILIVNMNIPVFMSKEVLWYIVIITVGLVIVSAVLLFTKNIVFGLVFMWAYLGIFMKHKSQVGHFITNPATLNYTAILLVLLTVVVIATFITNEFKLFSS